jgi:hypothetical protein
MLMDQITIIRPTKCALLLSSSLRDNFSPLENHVFIFGIMTDWRA